MGFLNRRSVAVLLGAALFTMCHATPPRAAPSRGNPETVATSVHQSLTIDAMRPALVERLITQGAEAEQAQAAVGQLTDADVQTLHEHPNMLHPAGDVSEGMLVLICVGAVLVVVLIVIAA